MKDEKNTASCCLPKRRSLLVISHGLPEATRLIYINVNASYQKIGENGREITIK